jgi:putative Mg2+ transporter-C (MgtC) family protein
VPTDEILIRLLAATAGGAILGINRKLRGKSAGLRTHALVALGSALAVLTADVVSMDAGAERGSVTRAIQGIIAGVGFLGAGTILKGKSESGGIRGLTTAATIWLSACVGVACGAGYEAAAAISVGLALLVLLLGGPLERLMRRVLGRSPARDEERLDTE